MIMFTQTIRRLRLNQIGRRHSSAFWIFSERVSSSTLNLFCVIAIARLLGPTSYGHWAFALSIIGILLATGHLGLDGLLIKKIVEKPNNAAHLLGTVSTLKFSVYLPVILIIIVFFFHRAGVSIEERNLIYVLLIPVIVAPLTSSLLAWTNAMSRFGGTARARITANILGSTAKLLFIFAGFGIIMVGLMHAAMFVLEAFFLLVVVWHFGGPLPWRWRPDPKDFGPLLIQGGYLFAATIFALLYLGMDIVMMRFFRGAYEVGTYALVPQIIQSLQILPYAITLSSFPDLVALEKDKPLFYRKIMSLINILLVIGIGIAVALACFALLGFELIFGPAYRVTVPILMVGSLSLPLLFLRQLTTKIYICTNQGQRLALIEGLGLVFSVALNLILVPRYGGIAAIGVLCAVCFFTVMISLVWFDSGNLFKGFLRLVRKIPEVDSA